MIAPGENRITPATPVQDSVGEDTLLQMFRLIRPDPSKRMSTWDGKDEDGNEYQLKTLTRAHMTTARDVGRHTLKTWRTEYWIIAKGKRVEQRFEVEEVLFLHPEWLEPAFAEIQKKIQADIDLADKVLAFLQDKLKDKERERLAYLLDRGSTLNNPKIPWKRLKEKLHGVTIRLNDPADHLRELVRAYPLSVSNKDN